MKTWIALLRGINVGGKNIVPMKQLKALMEAQGFSRVNSYIQSGNLVFDSPKRPEGEIGALIEKAFGFRPFVLILDREELLQADRHCPYRSDQGKTIHFFFLENAPHSPKLELLDAVKKDSEGYALIDKVFYLHTPEGFGTSKLVEKIDRAFPNTRITARNLNTINKLMGMVG